MAEIAPKEKLWNSNYLKVWCANFMIFFSFMLLTPLLPLYLSETFGADKQMIGIVLSGYTLTALIIWIILCIFPGVYSSRVSGAFCNSEDAAWCPIWSLYSIKQYSCHRCAASSTQGRRNRLLRAEQQYCNGNRSNSGAHVIWCLAELRCALLDGIPCFSCRTYYKLYIGVEKKREGAAEKTCLSRPFHSFERMEPGTLYDMLCLFLWRTIYIYCHLWKG